MTLVESQPAPEVSADSHRPLGLRAWGYLDGCKDRETPETDFPEQESGTRGHLERPGSRYRRHCTLVSSGRINRLTGGPSSDTLEGFAGVREVAREEGQDS